MQHLELMNEYKWEWDTRHTRISWWFSSCGFIPVIHLGHIFVTNHVAHKNCRLDLRIGSYHIPPSPLVSWEWYSQVSLAYSLGRSLRTSIFGGKFQLLRFHKQKKGMLLTRIVGALAEKELDAGIPEGMRNNSRGMDPKQPRLLLAFSPLFRCNFFL